MEDSDIFEMAKNPNSAFYVDNNHQKYINMAKRKHRNDVLKQMEESYEKTTNVELAKQNQPTFASSPQNTSEQQNIPQNSRNDGNILSNLLNNLDLKSILPLLSGKGDLGSILGMLNSGEKATDTQNSGILQLLNNPALKNLFKGKKKGSGNKKTTTEFSKEAYDDTTENTIDSYEKIETE